MTTGIRFRNLPTIRARFANFVEIIEEAHQNFRDNAEKSRTRPRLVEEMHACVDRIPAIMSSLYADIGKKAAHLLDIWKYPPGARRTHDVEAQQAKGDRGLRRHSYLQEFRMGLTYGATSFLLLPFCYEPPDGA